MLSTGASHRKDNAHQQVVAPIGGEGSGSLLRYVAGGGEGWEPCRDTRNDLTDHWEKTRALQMNGQGKS